MDNINKNYKMEIKSLNTEIDELLYDLNNDIYYDNNLKVSRILISSHRELSIKLSNLKYSLLHDYLSGNISKKKYKKNISEIKMILYKSNQETPILLKKVDNNIKDNYVTYLNENMNRYDNHELYIFFEKINILLFVRKHILFININNIYRYWDTLDFEKKEKIYLKLEEKIDKRYNNLLKIINPIIEYNIEHYKSIINEYPFYYIKIFQEFIFKKNFIKEFINYKRSILEKEKLLPLEIYSNEYISNYTFNINDIYFSLEILGKEVVNLVHKQIDNNLFYTNLSSKGISINDFSGNTIILLEKSYSLENAFVLSHELGHCLYNYYSDEKFITNNAILFSEISAIVNELFLYDYLIKNDKVNGTYFIDSIMKIITNGVIEYELIQKLNYENLNFDIIKEKYVLILKKLYGNNVITNDNIDILIDKHIDNGNYILKYLVALIVSINVYNKIKNNSTYLNKYRKFLKYSSKKSISKVFKELNIDLSKSETYLVVLKYIENLKNADNVT